MGNVWDDVHDVPVGSVIDIPYGANGALLGVRVLQTSDKPKEEFRTAAAIKEDADRLDGPADGECVTEPLIRPPTPAAAPCGESCTCTTPHTPAGVRMWSGETRLTIGITINLENYENLRLEVSGAAADREALIEYLDETLGRFAGKSEITKSKIEAYRRRVIG
jgi:hypothetical protein